MFVLFVEQLKQYRKVYAQQWAERREREIAAIQQERADIEAQKVSYSLLIVDTATQPRVVFATLALCIGAFYGYSAVISLTLCSRLSAVLPELPVVSRSLQHTLST